MAPRFTATLISVVALVVVTASSFSLSSNPIRESLSSISHSISHSHSPSAPGISPRRSSTALHSKLWDRLQIEEDPEPFWYLLNCVATCELDLLFQCRTVCEDLPDAIKFVVPTEQKTRSHGANKMVTETKVRYPGYVFAKLRLCPKVYETIQELDLCRSWMGTVNHIGHKKLPPAPVALNDIEVENFGLDEWEDEEEEENTPVTGEDGEVILDDDDDKPDYDVSALEVYLGLRVNDMVKVTKKGKFFDEDGIVRRLKENQIFVRFYTYGTMFEHWMDPGDVRKLTDLEAARGLSGPVQPITQREMDGDDRTGGRGGGYDDFSDNRPTSLRNQVGPSGERPRNRRQDRGYRGDDGDFGGSGQDQNDQKNWDWYKENRNPRGPAVQDQEWSMRAQSDGRNRGFDDDRDDARWAQGDVDSQWGRSNARPPSSNNFNNRPQQQQQQRRDRQPPRERNNRRNDAGGDWNSFVSPVAKPKNAPTPKEEEDFFASLVTDLSNDLQGGNNRGRNNQQSSGPVDTSDEDDFFASLMSEMDGPGKSGGDSRNDDRSSPGRQPAARSSPQNDDDFFASLASELSDDAVGGGTSRNAPRSSGNSASPSASEDNFFDSLLAEIGDQSNAPLGPQSADAAPPTSDDDFFASLESELGSVLDNEPTTTASSGSSSSSPESIDSDEDFFASLANDVVEESSVSPEPSAATNSAESSTDDFFASLKNEIAADFAPAEAVAPPPVVAVEEEAPKRRSPAKKPPAAAVAPPAGASGGDLSKKTIPVLKEMLREKGLKVSGKKADLIERLQEAA